MKKILPLALLFLWPGFTWAEHQHNLLCRHLTNVWAATDTTTQRYAPVRQVDILHFALDVTPDFKDRRVTGTATFTFETMLKPLEQLRLDAVDLEVRSAVYF